MAQKKRNLTDTDEYERFRQAVQQRIDSGELDAAEARRIVEALVRTAHSEKTESD